MKNQKGYVRWVVVILISIMAVGLVGAAWWYEENKENGSLVEINMPQSDSWDYTYKSSNELVARHVSNFLQSGDTTSEQWLTEQLSIDQTENEKLKDYFNNRDYFRDKRNVRKEIILSLCIQPDKAYSLIKETFDITETYNDGVIINYPVAEAAQCMIRSKLYREDAISFLRNILIDTNQIYTVKIAAAEALSDLGDKGSVPSIQQALELQTNKYAINYLKKSIKRIQGQDDLPYIDYTLLNGIKINFLETDIQEIKLINSNNNTLIEFSKNDFPNIIKYIKKGKKNVPDLMGMDKILTILLQNGAIIDIYYDDILNENNYFFYPYYDRYYDPLKTLHIEFESKELSDFIKRELNKE